MGNSPSKNDPLPKSLSSSDSSNDDLEPDERSSALCDSKYNKSSAIRIEPKKNIYIRPNEYQRTRRNSRKQEDLNLEIGVSMAGLLSGSSPGFRYGSSVDSDDLSSPVFTTVDAKDSELLLSVGSYSSSPKSQKTESKYADFGSETLVPISETTEYVATPPLAVSKDAFKNNLKLDRISKKLSDVSLSSSSDSAESPPLAPQYKTSSLVSIDAIIHRLIKVGDSDKHIKKTRKSKDKLPVTSDEIRYILNKSRSIFLEQPTLLRLSPSVNIVGDLHGQFLDLIRIFKNSGFPPHSNYLFLGDYVDRGYKSLETILLLLCYKIKYPENFFMLRGNHESANITKIYGFYDECKRRLPTLTGNHKLWKLFIDVFNTLPFAATINDKIFCIHGGLSPELHDLKQISDIKRPTDIPDKGLVADLLWSDPDASVKTFSVNHWPKNDRGVSYCFGKKHVDHFCNTFGFELIVRGHMVVEDGYEFFDRKRLVTVFSAPNYCGEFNNYGAVMHVDKSLCCSFDLLKPM